MNNGIDLVIKNKDNRIETFSFRFFSFTANRKPRFDVWRLALEVQVFLRLSTAVVTSSFYVSKLWNSGIDAVRNGGCYEVSFSFHAGFSKNCMFFGRFIVIIFFQKGNFKISLRSCSTRTATPALAAAKVTTWICFLLMPCFHRQ